MVQLVVVPLSGGPHAHSHPRHHAGPRGRGLRLRRVHRRQRPHPPRRPAPPGQRRPRLARPDDLPDRRRPLRRRRSQQRLQRRAQRPRPLPRRRLAGDHRPPRLSAGPRRHRAVDQPGGQEHRGGRRVRQLPRLLDLRLPAAQRPLRRRVQAARAGRRRPQPRHAGHPRRGHQPRRPALLLRHQRQRPARRHGQRRRPVAHLRPDLPQPRARQRVHGRRADLLHQGQGLPRAHHRVGPRVRPARGPGLELARLLRAGRHPVPELAGEEPDRAAAAAGLVRLARRQALVRRPVLVPPARPGLHLVARGRLLARLRPRAGDDGRLPGRAQGPRHRQPRRPGGAVRRVRLLDRGRRLRRLPHRHGQAHRPARGRSQHPRLLGRLPRPDAGRGQEARQAELLPVRRGVRWQRPA